MASPRTIDQCPMTWLPRPITQRRPMVTTGLVSISWSALTPAVRATLGPMSAPSPIERYSSL